MLSDNRYPQVIRGIGSLYGKDKLLTVRRLVLLTYLVDVEYYTRYGFTVTGVEWQRNSLFGVCSEVVADFVRDDTRYFRVVLANSSRVEEVHFISVDFELDKVLSNIITDVLEKTKTFFWNDLRDLVLLTDLR